MIEIFRATVDFVSERHTNPSHFLYDRLESNKLWAYI